MTDLNKIIDELSKLTVIEAAELSKKLEDKWGVTAAVPVAAAPTTSAAAPVIGGDMIWILDGKNHRLDIFLTH